MLDEVKEYLKITWDDEDSSLIGMIERGKNTLDSLAGINLDYVNQGTSKALLLDYCRYAYNNATEYFEENFQRDILRLQLHSAIEQNQFEVKEGVSIEE